MTSRASTTELQCEIREITRTEEFTYFPRCPAPATHDWLETRSVAVCSRHARALLGQGKNVIKREEAATGTQA